MSEPHSNSNRPQGQPDDRNSRPEEETTEPKRGLFGRLADFISQTPANKAELRQVIEVANKDNIIDDGTLVMIDGAIRLGDMIAEDAMVPISKVEMFDIDTPVKEMVDLVLDGGHSRFPVYERVGDDEDENRQNIIGILIAKELLKMGRSPSLSVRTLLRSPHFVPESRTLNRMLTDFRTHRQHMALVVDEFGRVSGVLTIEDVIEEIVGEIEDEFDLDENDGDIYALSGGGFRIAGDTTLEHINETFNEQLTSTEVETIGGYISHELGHVPTQGEFYIIGNMKFTVLHTRAGAVRWFKAEVLNVKDSAS